MIPCSREVASVACIREISIASMTWKWIGLAVFLLLQKVIKGSDDQEFMEKHYGQLYCDKEWYPFGAMCYKLGAVRQIGFLTFEKARRRCREYGGRLVSIHSQEEQDFLITFLLFKAKSNVWIGLHDLINETEFSWVDESSLNFRNWEPGEPSGTAHQKYEKEDCVVMNFQSKHDYVPGKWNDEECDQDRQYICEKEKDNPKPSQDPRFCPESEGGGWRHEQSCFHLVEEPLSWPDAEAYCVEKHKGHLATVQDFTTNSYIDYVFKKKFKYAWLGVKVNLEVFQQRWTSGWFVTYDNWEKNRLEECTAFNAGGNWSSVACTRKLPFICEVSSAIPPTLTPGRAGGICPPQPQDWRDLGGEKCYSFHTTQQVTWNQANFECLRRGGNLVSIHSEDENAVLINFVKYPDRVLFIGLYRSVAKEEKFAWSDGSPMDFEKWSVNEPNLQSEQCGEVYSGSFKWNDIPCDSKRGYICATYKIAKNGTEFEKNIREEAKCENGFSLGSVIGAIFCVLLVCALFGVLSHSCHLWDRGYDRMKKGSAGLPKVDKRAKYRSEIVVKETDLPYPKA